MFERAERKYTNGIKTLKNLPKKRYKKLHSLVDIIERVDNLKNHFTEKRDLSYSIANRIEDTKRNYRKQDLPHQR